MVIVCLLGVTTTTRDAVRGRGREAFRNIFERICEALKFFKFMVCLRLCSCRLCGVLLCLMFYSCSNLVFEAALYLTEGLIVKASRSKQLDSRTTYTK